VTKKTWRLAVLLILIPTVALAAWKQDSHSHTAGSTAGPNWIELTGCMEKMHMAMASIEPSGDNDIDFVKLMLPHHQAAIDMAKAELLYGKDPQIRRLAQEIITDQQSEIELMQLWLKQRDANKSRTEPSRSSEDHKME
jgi:uncharacterized protein (DUF305 family)